MSTPTFNDSRFDNHWYVERMIEPLELIELLAFAFDIPKEAVSIFDHLAGDGNVIYYQEHGPKFIVATTFERPPDFPLQLYIIANEIWLSPHNLTSVRRFSKAANCRVLIDAEFPEEDARSYYTSWMIVPSGEVYRVKLDEQAADAEFEHLIVLETPEPQLLDL
jgi:hypothetical protein